MRAETSEINEFMENYAKNILEGAANMHGCTCQISLMGAAHSMKSDEPLMERIRVVCENHLGLPVSEKLAARGSGSEDVSYMMGRVQEQGGQASFMRILTKEAGPGHSRTFDIDESALPNAVKIFCGVAYDILK